MKRSRFGAALLVALLLLGFGAQWGIGKCQASVAEDLQKAAETALAEDWEQTGRLIRRAREQWQRCYGFSAALADHDPLEQIDAAFAALAVWQAVEEPAAMAAGCRDLESRIRALIEEQQLSLRNLL